MWFNLEQANEQAKIVGHTGSGVAMVWVCASTRNISNRKFIDEL